jgi:ornithine cyclodeaminase/alanine dehydrogenase
MNRNGTLLLTRRDVASLLTIEDCTAAVERAFKMHGEGQTQPPGVLGIHAREGGFHIKAGILELDRSYFAAKVNANFPQNAKRFGLPLIQGVIVLSDAEDGYPLSVMDSIEITIQRTGAATAVAAKYLARPDSRTLTIVGCGNQGRVSLIALAKLFAFEVVFAYDVVRGQSQRFADELSAGSSLRVVAVETLADALKGSDVVVTCTPSKQAFVRREWIRPGTFIAAVGADNEDKQELEPELLAQNKTVVDVLEQAATIGDTHHAIASGVMKKNDVHAELGECVAGDKTGRTSTEEITIFDSTGMALQDVIVAAAVYEKAVAEGLGRLIDFGSQNTKASPV